MPLQTEREKGAHLLRRFGLGASEAELNYYLRDGLNGAIDRLLSPDEVEEAFDFGVDALSGPLRPAVNPQFVASWWTLKLLSTRRPLLEKMTVFWHDHFATSAQKVTAGPMMYQQNEILRKNALGDFRSLLIDVSQDPAMLFWLDNQYNVKGKPNENFAREVMELFTLGIGHYTETDIKQAAKCFTGWGIGRKKDGDGTVHPCYQFRPKLHDDETKSVLGKNGDLSGEDVLNLLCDQPRTAEFLTQKIWEWFVYPNPEPEVVSRFAKVYRDANLDTSALLKAIMRSSEFYSPKAERAIYKNPVDFVVATMRQLGLGPYIAEVVKEDVGIDRPKIGLVLLANQTMKQMGMQLLYPPDVSGWNTGPAWVSSATMVARISWGDRLFGQSAAAKLPVRYPAFQLFAKDPTPLGVAQKLVSVFDAPLSPGKMDKLVDAATGVSNGKVTPQNSNATAAAVAKLIFASPEFQFC